MASCELRSCHKYRPKEGSFLGTGDRSIQQPKRYLPEHSQKSLEKRWETIKNECSRFASYMAAVLRENPSRWMDADKTTEAVTRFTAIEERKFTLLHCWNILKDEPKWMDIRQKGTEDVLDLTGDRLPHASNTPDVAADQSSPSSASSKRPLGRDATKESRKKPTSSLGSAASAEYVSKMHDLTIERLRMQNEKSEEKSSQMALLPSVERQKLQTLEEQRAADAEIRALKQRQLAIEEKHRGKQAKQTAKQLALDAERLAIEKARADKESRLEDEKILGINPDACTPAQREYYTALQATILNKVRRPPAE